MSLAALVVTGSAGHLREGVERGMAFGLKLNDNFHLAQEDSGKWWCGNMNPVPCLSPAPLSCSNMA